GEGYPPCEPSVALNLKDTSNIVVASILNRIYVTNDGGKTWEKQRIESKYGVFGDPVLLSDLKGNIYFFHLSDPAKKGWESENLLDRMVCQKSEDQGKTWTQDTFFGYAHPKDQDKEWAALDYENNDIYVTWTQFDKYNSPDPEHKSNILFTHSSNGGKKWSDAKQINQYSGDCLDDDGTTEGAVPAVGPDGKLYVVWSHDEKIYFDRSYDKGKMWLRNDIILGKQPGGWSFDIPGLNRTNGMPSIVVDNSYSRVRGTIYVSWSDQRNGMDNTDIWLSRSSNGGDIWTAPIRINNDTTGNHQFLSSLTIDQTTGILYAVFYDRRNYDDNQTDVYLAYSANGGVSFENVKISETPFIPTEGNFFGDYTHIVAHKGLIVPVWTRMDEGKTSVMTAIIHQKDLIKLP
ncbi:MAG: glycoside hydrolase, partial [Cyclobacteriaceae bacterium]|nr:glycoside hydrolase [Cyclobacteriaceae bacterium]